MTAILISKIGERGKVLTSALKTKGIDAYHFPLQKIEQLVVKAPAWSDVDCVIACSQYAVQDALFAGLPEQQARRISWFAVGESTGEKLAEVVEQRVKTPSSSPSSEGLLALSELQDVVGLKILILKGKGGRGLLERQLTERGAKVDCLDLYERQAIAEVKLDESLLQASKIYFVAFSEESLNLFHKATFENLRGKTLTILVISERLGNVASDLGYTVDVCQKPDDESIIDEIIRLSNGSKR